MRGAEQPLPTAGHLASRGIHLVVCPSSDVTRARPLRVTLPSPSACWLPPACSFRPRGFAPPRRFPPRSGSRACCIPVPEGVRSVSRSRAPLQSTRRSLVRCARGFPVCAFTPLEEVPPPAAAPHRCGRCPLAVGPPRHHRCRCCAATLDLEALLRCRVRCDRRRCQRRPPSPSMGFVPLQGADRDRTSDPTRLRVGPVSWCPPTGPGVATENLPPASFARPTAGVTDAVDRDIPSTDSATAVTSGASGSKSVRGSPFAIRPARRRAEARRGPVRDRGPSWGF